MPGNSRFKAAMTNSVLSRLIDLLGSSLPAYISDSGIWSYPGVEQIKLALADCVGDQHSIVERAGTLLVERNATPPRPIYPIAFTALHDLDLHSLLPRILAALRRQVVEIEHLMDESRQDPTAHDLLADARQTTLLHSDIFEDMARGPAGTVPPASAVF